MDDNSTPDALDNDAGGTIDAGTLFEPTPSDDHSQTDSTESADKQEAKAEAPSEDTSTEDTGSESQVTTTQTEDETTTPASQFDTDLDEWATKRGHKLETEQDRIDAQDDRNKQREFNRERQAQKQAVELQQSIEQLLPQDEQATDDDGEYVDPLEVELKSLRQEMAQVKAQSQEERILRTRSEYLVDKGVTVEESKVMGDLLKELVDEGGKPAYEYWTDPKNLKTWHELAQARLAKSLGTSDVEEQARSLERERLAKVTNATGPNMSANSVETKKGETPEEARQRILSSDDD